MTHRQHALSTTTIALTALLGCTATLPAAVVTTGDTNPASSDSFWTSGGSTGTSATVGDTSTGEVTIDGGSMLATDATTLGNQAAGEGTVEVTGSGSTLSTEGFLTVGNFGTGFLNLLSGGTVDMGLSLLVARETGSMGTIMVSGAGSNMTTDGALGIGLAGTGSLTVNTGGIASATDRVILGNVAGGSGSLTVNGSGSSVSSGASFIVGRGGAGTLVVENGGLVSSTGDFIVSDQSGSTGSVTLDNGSIQSSGNFYASPSELSGTGTVTAKGLVGRGYFLDFDGSNNAQYTVTNGGSDSILVDITADGSGDLGASMTVRNGAQVLSKNAYLGYEAGETDTVTVTGAGSLWANGPNFEDDFEIGRSGTGNLVVEAGGSVTGKSIQVGRFTGSSGSIIIRDADSSIDLSGSLSVGYDGRGSLAVENGGTLDADALSIDRLILLPGLDGGSLSMDGGTINLDMLLNANRSSISGNGTIHTGGVAGQGYSLLFDGSSSTSTSWDGITLNVTTNSSSWFGADMEVRNGAVLNGGQGRIGRIQGDDITVLVTGAGTEWNNTVAFRVGEFGAGRLRVQDGALVSSSTSIGVGTGISGSGLLEVVGSGSRVVSTNDAIWASARGVISIADSGSIRGAESVEVGAGGQMNLFVAGDDQVQAGTDGTGDFVNDGTTRIVADTDLAAGTYNPISVGTTSGSITGSGTYEVYGGSWNAGTGEFTTTAPIDGTGGISVVDLSGVRASFDGGNLSASFASDAGIGSFDAVGISVSSIGSDEVLAAYSFTTDLADVFLSMDVGSGFGFSDFSVFYRPNSGSAWSKINPNGLVYDGERVHFLADNFSDYAIAVPEPSQAAFLMALVIATILVGRRSRRF